MKMVIAKVAIVLLCSTCSFGQQQNNLTITVNGTRNPNLLGVYFIEIVNVTCGLNRFITSVNQTQCYTSECKPYPATPCQLIDTTELALTCNNKVQCSYNVSWTCFAVTTIILKILYTCSEEESSNGDENPLTTPSKPLDLEAAGDVQAMSIADLTLSQSSTGNILSSSSTLNPGLILVTSGTLTENITVITVSAVCGVIIFLLLVVIGLLVYFKVIKLKRHSQSNTERDIYEDPDQDIIRVSNDPRNTYSDLVRYENQENQYAQVHLYANPQFHAEETKVE